MGHFDLGYHGNNEDASCHLESSYNEEEFVNFLCSLPQNSLEDSFSEEDFRKFLDSTVSTPQKNNERESSYNEEEWKIFLDQTAKDNDEFLWNGDMSSSLSSVETTEGDIDIEADPEFFGEVYALPKCPKLSFGEPPSRESSLLKKALDIKDIIKNKEEKCKCKQNCLGLFSVRDIYNIRERYWTHSRRSQSQILIHAVSQGYKDGRFTFLTLDNGKKVCQLAFLQILRVNKNALTGAKKLCKRGAKTTPGKTPKSPSEKSTKTMSWFEQYVELHGDKMPDARDVLLPYKTTKVGVYESYRVQVDEESRVSPALFYKIWKEHFPHIKIKDVSSFTQCARCAGLAKKLEQTIVPSKRAELLKQRAEHNERQMLERKHYYKKREQSRADSQNYLSLIIDGMDQSKSNLPHFTGRKPKNINPSDLLKTHITGVINHGQRRFDTFVDMNQWPHDPNLTINVLLLALQKAVLVNDKLPGTLYLQADNCWRENKNKYVLSFCELLVRENIFNEVQLSFLIVGHTHEDVDAAFSQISTKLRQKDVETYDDLLELLPSPTDLKSMFDVKAWLEPHMSVPQKHTVPLHFRFINAGQTVNIQYKGLHSHQWKNLESSFFKVKSDGKPSLPSGTPKYLKPEFDSSDLERLRKQIDSVRHLFSSAENYEWWMKFLQTLHSKQSSSREWILKKLPRQKKNHDSQSCSRDAVPPALQELLNKETVEPQVTIVRCSQTKKRGLPKKTVRSGESKKKTKGSGKKHTTIISFKRVVIVQLDKDVKQHMWYMILHMLISNLILFYISQTLSVLYILLWSNMLTFHMHLIMIEWLKKRYVCAENAKNNVKDYFHDHYISSVNVSHSFRLQEVAV